MKSGLLKMGRRQWLLLLLAGLLLTVIALPVSDKNESRAGDGGTGSFLREDTGDGTGSRTELEEKLETILSQAEGVGKVRVMLMTGEEKDAGGFYSSGETKITGVLIAAQGADNSVVVQNIQQAVMALFQVEAHKIKIMKMK